MRKSEENISEKCRKEKPPSPPTQAEHCEAAPGKAAGKEKKGVEKSVENKKPDDTDVRYSEDMAMSVAQDASTLRRDRQARWDATHVKTASTRLTVAEWENLRRECAIQGITVYQLLRRCIAMYLLVRRVRAAKRGGDWRE